MGKGYILYDEHLDEITAYFENKKTFKLFQQQRPDVEMMYREIDNDDLTSSQLKALKEKRILDIEGILITETEYGVIQDNLSYSGPELGYAVNKFLSIMQYIKFSDAELVILETYLSIIRKKVELEESDENMFSDSPEEMFDEVALILDTYKFIKR